MFRDYEFRRYHWPLIINVIILVVFGIIAIGSATQINSDLGTDAYVKRQIFGLIVGLIFMLIVSMINYKFIAKFYPAIYGAVIALLFAVRFFGDTTNNARRWIEIAGIRMQPSEFAKLMLVIVIAKLIDQYTEQFNKPWFLMLLSVIAGLPILLVNIQPDLSTSLMLLGIFLVVLFVGGLDFRYILAAFIIGIPVFLIGYNYIQSDDQQLLEDYQVDRIMALVDPESAPPEDKLQTDNSIQAIGSGQLNGKGLYQGKLNQYNYLPEPQTDFIFSIIGEEFGFIGSTIVIALILVLLIQCLWIAKSARDLLGKTIIGGITGMIGIQTFVNIGVVTGMLPNTGLPLPFISAGLSSLLTNMIAIGIILNISMQRKSINE